MAKRKLCADTRFSIWRFVLLFSCALQFYYSRLDQNEGFCRDVCQCKPVPALFAGGIWAYFKFAKGRTFRDRLSPTVSGKLISIDGAIFLIVTIQLENVGLSRIAFDQTASALYVFEHVVSEVDEILRVKNNRSTLFRVFDDTDRYIEPNEVVERQTLIALPRVPSVGYQLELEVFSDSGYTWRATTIVDKSAFAHNERRLTEQDWRPHV